MQKITRYSIALSTVLIATLMATRPSFAADPIAVNIGSTAATIGFYLLIVGILLAAIVAEVWRSSTESVFDKAGRPVPTEITLVARPRQA
ncbi:MAG: hypothetical protein GXP01_05095 [Alphaproteobacteria bacterium]|nr:hypothetical protein [Alphaproteobacteria bacterium]